MLNKKQEQVLASQTTETFFVGGLGSGKTYTCAHWLKAIFDEDFDNQGLIFGLFAPIDHTAKKVTLPKMLNTLETEYGITEGIDYVIGKNPPDSWGVAPFSKESNDSVLTTNTGNYLIIKGLSNYDHILRGLELDRVFVDEYRDIKEDVRPVLKGRLRGEAFKRLGLKHQILYATTPPADPTELKELEQNKNITFVFSSTYDNKENLPVNYISDLKDSYPPNLFRREVMGELITIVDSAFFWSFKEEMVQDCEYDKNLPVHVSFDFNVNPMTAIIVQQQNKKHAVIDEFRLENSNIIEMSNNILDKYGSDMFVYGDASGLSRTVTSPMTPYRIAQNILKFKEVNFRVSTRNMSHSDSFHKCNNELLSGSYIIDKRCKYLLEDMRFVQIKNDGIDKSNLNRGHLLDCLRYYMHKQNNK